MPSRSARSRGGTDLCTGFLGPSPLVPVWSGEISCRMLGAKVEAFDEAGAIGRRAGGRARHHRADAVDAGRVLGRPRGRAPARGVLLDLPGRLAARRLADDHRARLVHRHRPERRDAQARRRADRDIGVLRDRRGAARGRRQPRRPPRGRGRRPRRAAAVRRPARRPADRRRPAATDRRCAARGAVAAPRAGRDPRGRRRPADAVRQEARGAGEADPAGHACRRGRLEGRAGRPGGARAVRGTGRGTTRPGRRGDAAEIALPSLLSRGVRPRRLRGLAPVAARAGPGVVPRDHGAARAVRRRGAQLDGRRPRLRRPEPQPDVDPLRGEGPRPADARPAADLHLPQPRGLGAADGGRRHLRRQRGRPTPRRSRSSRSRPTSSPARAHGRPSSTKRFGRESRRLPAAAADAFSRRIYTAAHQPHPEPTGPHRTIVRS